jgi:hypothetical protein
LRGGYSTACQFNTAGPPGTIVWYPVDDSAPDLGITTAFASDNWTDQRDGNPYPIGEIKGSPRPYTKWKGYSGKPGGHVCGTAEDFANGGTYDPLAPPAVYDNRGVPGCCGAGIVVRGGEGQGGTARPIPTVQVAATAVTPPWSWGTPYNITPGFGVSQRATMFGAARCYSMFVGLGTSEGSPPPGTVRLSIGTAPFDGSLFDGVLSFTNNTPAPLGGIDFYLSWLSLPGVDVNASDYWFSLRDATGGGGAIAWTIGTGPDPFDSIPWGPGPVNRSMLMGIWGLLK